MVAGIGPREGSDAHLLPLALPDSGWASSPAATPPSFGEGSAPAVGYSMPSGGVTVTQGQPASVRLGVAPAGADNVDVDWNVQGPQAGVRVSPSSGVLKLQSTPSGATCGTTRDATESLALTATAVGTFAVHVDLRTTGGATLPPVVIDVTAQP